MIIASKYFFEKQQRFYYCWFSGLKIYLNVIIIQNIYIALTAFPRSGLHPGLQGAMDGNDAPPLDRSEFFHNWSGGPCRYPFLLAEQKILSILIITSLSMF